MVDLGVLEDLLVLLGIAILAAYLLSRLRISPIVGYLVTGMLAGPHGYHLVHAEHEVEIMAEVGVVLLLFTIGLEMSFSHIVRLRRPLLIGGSVQVVLTGLVVFLLGWGLGLAPAAAAVLGMAVALSSTAIVLKMLMERGEVETGHGRTSLAILLFQDLCVVIFLVLLPLLGGKLGSISVWGVVGAMGLLGALVLFARYLMQPLLRAVLVARSAELFRLTILALVLATAWLTSQAGLSLALGAFLAGLALSESPYAHQALSDILPFRDSFLAIFFISIGMLVDVRLMIDQAGLLVVLWIGLLLAKTLTGTVAALFSMQPLRSSLLIGIVLFQVGEFSFVLLKQAVGMNLLSREVYQTALSVIVLSILATPFAVRHAATIADALTALFGVQGRVPADHLRGSTGNLVGHVVIAGYGLSGRNVGNVLTQMKIPCLHVELNGEAVERGRAAGDLVVYGDVTSRSVLEGVGLEHARALVIAINDPGAVLRAIRVARDVNPGLYVLARTRYVAELDRLTELGADEVIPDEFEASLQLASCILRRFQMPDADVVRIISSLRREHYQNLRPEARPSGTFSSFLSVLDGAGVEAIAVPDDSPCLNRTLAEIALRTHTGATVVGVVQKGQVQYGATATLRPERGDTLLVLGAPDEVQRAKDLLAGKAVEPKPSPTAG